MPKAQLDRTSAPASADSTLQWRSLVRVVVCLFGATVLSYIYIDYLIRFDWAAFGRRPPMEGQSSQMLDYVVSWQLDAAFEHLKAFSFSAAMLSHGGLYTFGMAPCMFAQLLLERQRVSWLQALVAQRLPRGQTDRAIARLELYFSSLVIGSAAFLSLGVFHIDLPRMHYLCSGSGLLFTMAAIVMYATAPFDFRALEGDKGDAAFASWIADVSRWVLPTLRIELGLTALCVVSAIWKCNQLGDDLRSLVFGVLETIVIVGYQVILGTFFVDDKMVDRTRSAPVISSLKCSFDESGVPETLMAS